MGQTEILKWINQATDESQDKRASFRFLSDNSIEVRCDMNEDCPLDDYCSGMICIEKSTVVAALRSRLKPSANCPDQKPCRKGLECTKPKCNMFGDACWCPIKRRRGRAVQTLDENAASAPFEFVEGRPEDWDIPCYSSPDCPYEWYCAEQVNTQLLILT